MNKEINIGKGILCPVCGKDLGEGSQVDVLRIGWVCSHDDFDIKIYKELK